MLLLVVLSAFFVFAQGQTTNVSQCTISNGDLPINQYVVGCTEPPCLLPQLRDAVINVEFRAPRNVTKMTTLATATLNMLPITIPFDLQENAMTCNFLTNGNCPLVEGEVVQYELRMHIESFFPVGTAVTVEFRVVDENTEILWCIRVPIRIVSPVNTARKIDVL